MLGSYGGYGNVGLYGALVAYGSLNLTESSPSQVLAEAFSLDEIKAYLKLPLRVYPDQAEDDEIGSLISAAREQAEILQGRDLVRKQWDLSLDYWVSFFVELRDPLFSVDLVRYRDSAGNYTTLTEDVNYVVDRAKHPGLLAPPYNGSWPSFSPWPSSSILVRFTSGFAPDSAWWSDSGARVKNGMKLLISNWFNNKLPFEKGLSVTHEYPFAVTSCLTFGALERPR